MPHHLLVLRVDGSLRFAPRLAVILLVVVLAASVIAISDFVSLTFDVSFSAVGALLAIRRPRNPVGWLLLANAVAFVGTSLPGPNVDVAALRAHSAPLDLALLTWFGAWAGGLAWLLYAALAMVFPTGHLPAGRAGVVARVTLVLGLVVLVFSMTTPTVTVYPNGESADVPNPLGLLPAIDVIGALQAAGLGLLLGTIAVGIGLLIRRYRGAKDVERLQIRWVLASIAATLVAIIFGITLSIVSGDALGGLVWIPAIVAYPTLPIAVGIAILRYRLYELDRIVNRALVYGSLTAILAGVVAGTTAVSQKVLNEITGGSEFGTAVIALVVVTLYTPLRKRIEAVVDRYFKYEQRQFGSYRDELRRIAGLVDPRTAADRLARETLAETRATGVAVVDRDRAVLASAGHWPVATAARITIDGESALNGILIGPRIDGHPHEPSMIENLSVVASLADLVARAGVLGEVAASHVELPSSSSTESVMPDFVQGIDTRIEGAGSPAGTG